ncbi:hypothetical protein PMAYCL1PPCAC_17159, partial [Pristionchus mayeri]
LRMYTFIFLTLLAWSVSAQQMQPQCLCSEFNPCVDQVPAALEKCGDRCNSSVTELGGDYQKVRQCVIDQQTRIKQAAECVRAAFGNVRCSATPGAMVPRRHAETFQIAATRELNAALTRSNLFDDAAPLIQHAKKSSTCWINCGKQHQCAKLQSCGVRLPSDNDIISIVKKCAMDAGFTTPVAKEICGCLVNAGIKQLAPMCPKIIVS